VLPDERLAHFVSIIQCHNEKPKDQLWRPIVQMALPPQIMIPFSTNSGVNPIKCYAVVLNLCWAQHSFLCCLPLSLVIPLLLQQIHPRLVKDLQAVGIPQHFCKSIVGPHSIIKQPPDVLPTAGIICFFFINFEKLMLAPLRFACTHLTTMFIHHMS
jgi:hypothetical protein